MERARRTVSMASSRRRTNPASHSPQSTPESVSEPLPSVSPSLSNDIKSPQSAPPARRSSKTLQHTSSFSAPASSRSAHSRKRSKTMDEYGYEYEADDIDSPKKGGHTLRRRARVDYTFEHIDDEVIVPNSTSSTRNKKRRSDNSYDSEELNSQDPGRRRASLDADTSTSRRRNPARKSSAEVAAYIEAPEEPEHKVQDTIEVAGSLSDRENSTSPAVEHSNTSSQVSLPAKPSKPDSAGPETSTHEPTDTTQDTATIPEDLDSKPHDEDLDRPDNQLLQEAGASLPNGATSTTAEASQLGATDSTTVSEPLSPKTSSQQELNAVSTKTEPAEEKNPNALPFATTQSPKVDAAATKTNNPTTDHESTNGSESGEKGDQSSSPSSQIQKQLDGSPDDTAADIKKDPGVEEDVSMTDVGNGELKDEPAEDAVQAEPAEKMTTPTPTPEAKDVQLSLSTNADTVVEDVVPTKAQIKPSSSQNSTPSSGLAWRPQPTPAGRWAYLTPYVEGDTTTYPEKKESSPEDETPAEEPATEEKDTEKDLNGMEPMVEDNDDAPEAFQAEAPTPALNTPTRGSPVADSMEPTAANSPVPVVDEADDGDVSDSDDNEPRRYFRYRKLRDAEEYTSLLETPEDMTTEELYELIAAVNVSMVQWQTEWTSLGKVVDDYENSLRRRAHDAKYEARTRNLRQHGVNYEEPEFVVRGYKAKEKEGISETRYLQGQDRIMAAAYGFEYDPHPSKIGRQNPETQQAGIMTRGRSLRNQPRQTAKATEADEVTGKRTRKPVQLFDPAAQDISRSSTPVPTRTRRRKTGNGDEDMVTSSFNGDGNSEMDEPPSRTKRRRIGRLQTSAPNVGDDYGASQDTAPEAAADETVRPIRRGRHRAAIRYDDDFAEPSVDDEQQPKQPKRHLLTLKIPRGKNFSEPSSAITDNGDSRPSTASSESSSHTAESSYSFRPKRQKRFRDEQEEAEAAAQGPPKKRGRRTTDEAAAPMTSVPAGDATPAAARKTPKIKVVRAPPASRTGTPSSIGGDAEEPRKDYKLMTKSEKMSASMKSRWANGNMAGAVEKRKATLAAKKAAQAAADQKSGTTTPKGNKAKPKKDGPLPPQDSQPMPPATPTMGYPFTPA
ncbi:hypothetical protein ISF_05180 [Cordyceps fumosorosea ARSEF 2679]|uniref:Uncharacterized protein n=1 Tax=Cordyceps fumosorosea (strain ARSEF 2679) TaxID=1081104 RepID=A0A167V2S3_CORFA|nr:hypothetical protein ISF_05180 [Cordyceps fumosorosea ARSEF 2679]OAA62171.1 hypothetical protein ISF_05180 [Cordyceps fumosorosea ARSEF 2679]